MKKLLALLLVSIISLQGYAFQSNEAEEEQPAPLRLDQGFIELDTPEFNFKLVKASQTVAGLQPKEEDEFDFTPSGDLEARSENEFYHLGDLNLKIRLGDSKEWKEYSSAKNKQPVKELKTTGSQLAASDISGTMGWRFPIQVNRYWELVDNELTLRFEITNTTGERVEVGALGIPMIFNNILSGKSLDSAHAVSSFYDPYIGQDAGYLQVTRLNGHGPALVVVPEGNTPFEAWRPLNDDKTRRGITFEGFYEWMVHSKAYAENEWSEADPWNPATSAILEPTESRSYAVKFLISDSIRDIENTLLEHKRPVAVGFSGYVLPMDQEANLYLNYDSEVKWIEIDPKNSVVIKESGTTPNGWKSYSLSGKQWGRSRVTVHYEDGTDQAINYKVIKPEHQVVDDLGNFLTTKQWFDTPDDPFGRTNSVITYHYGKNEQVAEDNRAWVAGLSDEGGAGSWVAAIMKQLIQPEKAEIEKMELFVDDVVWGGIQHDEGEEQYAVRKSLFYYEPDMMPDGTYSDDVPYGGWPSWNKEGADLIERSYNYPHVAALHWVMYRLSRNYEGLVDNHSWNWYLENAYQTAKAMVNHAPYYAQFGQMEGSVFLFILIDMKREGWTEKAKELESMMRARADIWESLGFPFGSEMPWDSTGQEEVYAWCRYFGFDEKALVTLNAILGYMPTVPHWGYNGSARRYWDFLYAGDLSRVERQLHHYGSGLNSIPVLMEYRMHPDDLYLLRVGYGGVQGSIANITQDGFGPAGFHSYPSTLRIDYLSGDYGPGFYGHAVNTGMYLIDHPEFGWQAFGGNISEDGDWVEVEVLNSARSRAYIASVGLWLTLDAGQFETIAFNPKTKEVKVQFDASNPHTPNARLRIEQPATVKGVKSYNLKGKFAMEREAYVIPLSSSENMVVLEE